MDAPQDDPADPTDEGSVEWDVASLLLAGYFVALIAIVAALLLLPAIL